MSLGEHIFNQASNHIDRLWVFITASVILAVLIVFYRKKTGQWFALMTIVWALINSGVTWWLQGHIHIPTPAKEKWTYAHVKEMMILNLVLDVVYLLSAWYLIKRSRSSEEHQLMLHHFGRAVYVQGAGLLLLDGWFLTGLQVYTL